MIKTIQHPTGTTETDCVSFSPDGKYLDIDSKNPKVYRVGDWMDMSSVKGVMTQKAFRDWGQVECLLEAESLEIQEKKIEEEKREFEESKQRTYRSKHKLCLECGEKLGFRGTLIGAKHCRKHRD